MALKRENRSGIKENTHVERKSDARSDSGESEFLSAVGLSGSDSVFILGVVGIGSRRVGAALWPAVVLHTAMTAWCITSIRHLSGTEEADSLRQ